jgi:hypothetical protein
LVYLTHKMALPFLRKIRKPIPFSYNEYMLTQLPSGSLGNDLIGFLQERDLKLLPHYVRHDLKHVLLGYDTTDRGEACLQCFMLGNGRVSFPVLATVLYSAILMPEYWKQMKLAFKQGKTSASIHHWDWNNILSEQTKDLRAKIFNHV